MSDGTLGYGEKVGVHTIGPRLRKKLRLLDSTSGKIEVAEFLSEAGALKRQISYAGILDKSRCRCASEIR